MTGIRIDCCFFFSQNESSYCIESVFSVGTPRPLVESAVDGCRAGGGWYKEYIQIVSPNLTIRRPSSGQNLNWWFPNECLQNQEHTHQPEPMFIFSAN